MLFRSLSCTDKVDGYLARSRNEITDFGKFLDPIADKLLVFSALLLFLDFGMVTVWSVFIILFRELLVSALRMVASAAGAVSYTHLDVYKRQALVWAPTCCRSSFCCLPPRSF